MLPAKAQFLDARGSFARRTNDLGLFFLERALGLVGRFSEKTSLLAKGRFEIWRIRKAGKFNGSDERSVFRLGGLNWTRNEFCGCWRITGAPGTGKTRVLERLLRQLVRSEDRGQRQTSRPWGGLLLGTEFFWKDRLAKILAEGRRSNDLQVLTTRPIGAREDWLPSVTLNLLSDESISAREMAETIAAAADRSGGSSETSPEVRAEAVNLMAQGIELLRWARTQPRLRRGELSHRSSFGLDTLCRMLCDRAAWKLWSASVEGQAGTAGQEAGEVQWPAPHPLIEYMRGGYWQWPQLAGGEAVRRLIIHYLGAFTHREMAEVFCRGSTFDPADFDRGRVVLLTMERPFQEEHGCVSALLQLSWLAHLRRRLERPRGGQTRPPNLLLLLHDGADDRTIGSGVSTALMRQAQAAVIRTGAHLETSQVLAFGDENLILLRPSDAASAADHARLLGKWAYWRLVISRRTFRLEREEAYQVDPAVWLGLPDGVGVVLQPGRGWRRFTL